MSMYIGNKRYVRLVDGQVTYPKYTQHRALIDDVNGRVVCNPRAEHYAAAGYVEVSPEDRDGQYWTIEAVDGQIAVIYHNNEDESEL